MCSVYNSTSTMAATPEPRAGQSSNASPESLTLQKFNNNIVTHFKSQPGTVSGALFEKGYISSEAHDHVHTDGIPDLKKAQNLVSALRDKVKLDPSVYHGFISILKKEGPSGKCILEQLEQCFRAEQAALTNHSREDSQTKSSEAPKEAVEELECSICCKLGSIVTKHCLDCKKKMCDECTSTHKDWPPFKSHNVVSEVKPGPKSFSDQTPSCKEHACKASLYCETCSDLICYDCIFSSHKGHSFGVVKDVFPKYKEKFASQLTKLKDALDKTEQALGAFDARENEIYDQGATVKDKIEKEIEQSIQFLSKRKTELTANLELLIQQKLQELSTQKINVEKTQAEMSSCLERAETNPETGSEGEVLRMKKPVLEQIEDIMTEFDPDTLQPKTVADIELFTDSEEEFSKVCKYFGEVACNTLCAENSYATGDGRNFAIKDSQASVEVHPMTRRNEKFEGEFKLTAKLFHTKNNKAIKCDIKQENGRHTITYQPGSRGIHHLHIRINGKLIQGSKYTVAVAPSLEESFTKPVRVMEDFVGPHRAVTNSKGVIIVSDQINHQIIRILHNRKIFRFGSKGTADGEFSQPCGVAVDPDDNIYVVDSENNRIQKFSADGTFVKKVGCQGSGSDEFDHPVGIYFNKSDKNLYVCDQKNHRIQVITTDLKFVRCFGEKGAGNGQLQKPKYAAFDDSKNLYVTDYANDRVQVFTAKGKFVRTFSKKRNEASLLGPYGIAIDSGNIVYVSELSRNCISMFTTKGDFIESFGSTGTEEGQFNEIHGLMDDSNSLIVSETGNSRLQVFSI